VVGAYQLALPELTLAQQRASKQRWNAARSVEDADFFTVGYSGHDIISFTARLREAGVRTLLDIRFHAASLYKPEFNASRLAAHLRKRGIEYQHLPELGVPRDIRSRAIGRTTRRRIWNWYDQWVVDDAVRNLHWFFNTGDHPVALMCVELDPRSCHRHRLAIALSNAGLRYFDL
jgi:uncharacterized protein (DUF488 family)